MTNRSNLQQFRYEGVEYNEDVGGVVNENTPCKVIFRDHVTHLISLIEEFGTARGFILCAVAWFTNADILDALIRAKRRGCTVIVIVQKEDFLRPDSLTTQNTFYNTLRRKYRALGQIKIDVQCGPCHIDELLSFSKSLCEGYLHFDYPHGNPEHRISITDAVRCLGNYNADNNPSHPRMHNKFVVFGKVVYDDDDDDIPDDERMGPPSPQIISQCVWTGSFNFSKASTESFENVVVLRGKEVAEMYRIEFARMFLITEPLNWSSQWMNPTSFFRS